MITTLIMALPIFISLHLARGNAGQVRRLWAEARWYEKAALCLLFVPIPGPVDELVALVAIKRITRRRRINP